MTPSKYQEAIFSAIKDTWDNLIIEAVAGSGKTTTIVEGLKLLPSTKKCIFLAFNKSIVDTLNSRVPSFVDVKTMHGLGWSVCKQNIRWFRSNPAKVRNIFYYKVNNLKALSDGEKKVLYKQCNALCTLVGLLKANLVTTEEQFTDRWMDIATKNDIHLPKERELADFRSALRKVYWKSVEDKIVIDFDDMIFFPATLTNWVIPVKYDCIFIDEAQDLSPVQHLFLERFLTPTGRIVAVGDSSQAIYGFRGASPLSMSELKKKFSMKPLPLSICYRCGSSIVENAKRLVPQIESHELAEVGSITRISKLSMFHQVQPEDIIICRNVSPLLSLLPDLLSFGKRIKFPYPEIIEELSLGLEFCRGKMGSTTGESVLNWLAKYTLDTEHGEELTPTLRFFAQKYLKFPLTNKHFEEHLSEDSPSVFVSTVHKAKGLEANRVFIYRPDLMPSENAKLDWQLLQEKNLEYVAITRAKKELVYVEE